MRSVLIMAVSILAACSSGDTTEPANDESAGEEISYEIAYADVLGDDVEAGTIYVTTDATRGRLLTDVPGGPDFPADWSPDGHTLLFRHFELGRYSLWRVEDDGSGLRRLTPNTENVAGGGLWIPGVSRIAYVRGAGENFEWRTIATDGSGSESLMGGLATDMPTIAWSPDGRRIAFSKGSLPGLWIANADGSAARQLTTGAFDYLPRWSPDGARIAFQSQPIIPTGVQQIGVVDVNGTNRRLLTEGPVDARPAWSPDSRSVAFDRSMLVAGVPRCTVKGVEALGGPVLDLLPWRATRACASAVWRSVTTTR